MVGQKQRIIRRFEREARKHLKEKKLTSNFLDTIMFSLADIKRIIMFEGYACGHNSKPIILDDNELSMSAFLDWCSSTGWQGDKTQCWGCYCEETSQKDDKMMCKEVKKE